MAYAVLTGVKGVLKLKDLLIIFAAEVEQLSVSEDGKWWWLNSNPKNRWLTGCDVFDPWIPAAAIHLGNEHAGIIGVFNTELERHLEVLVAAHARALRECAFVVSCA